MPTIKTQGGKVVTKDGKVSCNCCVSCTQAIGLAVNFPGFREIEINALEFAQIYAGGTIVTEQTMSGSSTGF